MLRRGIRQRRLHAALTDELPQPARGAQVLEPGARFTERNAVHGLEVLVHDPGGVVRREEVPVLVDSMPEDIPGQLVHGVEIERFAGRRHVRDVEQDQAGDA